LRFGAPLEWSAVRWLIAERTGWTLDVIDNLDAADLAVAMEVWHGLAVSRESD